MERLREHCGYPEEFLKELGYESRSDCDQLLMALFEQEREPIHDWAFSSYLTDEEIHVFASQRMLIWLELQDLELKREWTIYKKGN